MVVLDIVRDFARFDVDLVNQFRLWVDTVVL